MRKICVINHKGGVGKTTTAINLAAGLAMNNKKVLLIDLDAQGHVSKFFPIREFKKDTYEFLTNGADAMECAINVGLNLDVIASSPMMRGAEMTMMQKEEPTLLLTKKMHKVEKYDYVIIDSPPSGGIVVQNALNYVDEVIIPVSTEPLAVDGLEKIQQTIKEFAQHSGHQINISKVVPTMYDRRNKICKKVLEDLQDKHYEVVSDPIHVNSKLKEAPAAQKSIFTYAASSRGAKDYMKLVKSILADREHVRAEPQPEVSPATAM